MGWGMREYWIAVHRRAFKDARTTLRLDSPGRAITRIGLSVLAIGVLFFVGSEGAWKDEIWVKGVLSALIVCCFPVVYLWWLLATPPKLHREKEQQIAELKGKIEKKISLTFDPDVPGCVVCTRLSDGRGAKFFRIKTAYSGNGFIGPCSGWLTSVGCDGSDTPYADSLGLTWAPANAPDRLAKNIPAHVPAFLDVGFVDDKGRFALATEDFVIPNYISTLFHFGSVYLLDIVVSCPEAPSARLRLELVKRPTMDETHMRVPPPIL